MSGAELLDSTDKIRARLEVEYQLCFQNLLDSVISCLGYKTSLDRPTGRKPSVCPQWKHFQSVIRARESLHYRLGSLVWHCRQFPRHQQEFAERISSLRIARQDHHNETRDAYYIASYMLDDVVFSAVSVFDYLAQLIFKMNYPEKRGQQFWSDLVTHREFEDPKLKDLVRTTDSNLVRSLSRLRGRSIHIQADIGGLKQSDTYNQHGITHTFEYLMPKEALRQLPFFDEEKEFPIEPGAYLIALHAVVEVRAILLQLGKFEYACVYHPWKERAVRKPEV